MSVGGKQEARCYDHTQTGSILPKHKSLLAFSTVHMEAQSIMEEEQKA